MKIDTSQTINPPSKHARLNSVLCASMLYACTSTFAYAAPEVEFNGLFEASLTKVESETSQGKIDKIEFGVDVKFNDVFSVEIGVQNEEVGTDEVTGFFVETALLHLDSEFGTLSAGKLRVPFSMDEKLLIEESTTHVDLLGMGLSFTGALGPIEYQVYVVEPTKDELEEVTGNAYARSSELSFGDLKGVNLNIDLTESITFNTSYATIDNTRGISGTLTGSFSKFGWLLEATDIEGEETTRTNIEGHYKAGFGVLIASLQTDGDEREIKSLGFVTEVYENTHFKVQVQNVSPQQTDEVAYNSIAGQLTYEF